MKKKKHFVVISAVIACILVVSVVVGVIMIPIRYGSFKDFWIALNGGPVEYPVVLVHGLGGWGEQKDNEGISYWGSTTGNLAEYLRAEEYTVCVPSVGPYSSTWDRTCELYAQLTGTTVDYGEAHAKAHNHARYGRTYDTALVPDWGEKENGGQTVKIRLIGHSFGGATVRMLTSLLAYGDDAEKNATGEQTSPLFTGGKQDWVFSVTTLCAPHNGSQLTCIVNDLGSLLGVDNTVDFLTELLFKALKQNSGSGAFDDLMLDQFGIGSSSDEQDDVSEALKSIESAGNDHAYYDLSPDGAAELNQRIKTVDSVYYFSYAYSTTKQGTILNGMVPQASTLPALYPVALAMGSYSGTTPGGIVIDESWHDNDGLVSVISAQFPTGEKHADLPEDKSQICPGVWYVAPTAQGDHGTVIGLNADADATHRFYDTHLQMLEAIR